MDDIWSTGRVTSSTGDVDSHGEIVNRLLAQVGPDCADSIDAEEQTALVLGLLERARTRGEVGSC